ncbi:MAG: hypothetical protein QM778_12975 [Myxococcales bacterium]
MKRLLPALLWMLVGSFTLTSALSDTAHAEPPAQSKKKSKKKKKGKKAEAEANSTPAAPAPARESEPKGPAREGAEGKKSAQELARAAAQESSTGADAQIVKEGDTNVKVMSFTGLDIEGRLKSPQLLYFVNRVHAEFERPKLPHRSFMPELERSTQRDPLR